MTEPMPVTAGTIDLPATREVDARNRAARTLVQGLLVDVGAAVVVAVLPAVSSIEWTPLWWGALGLAVAKSVVTAVVSYGARKLLPPAVGASTGEDLIYDDTQEDSEPDGASSAGGYL